MLRIVDPAPGGQGTDPPAGRRRTRTGALSLTEDEVRHLRAATRNIARSYGGLAGLARALGVHPGILTRKRRPSPGLAVALARLTRIPVETLLSGKLAAVPSPAPAPPSAPGGAS
jgi:hypothetical protein